MKILLHVLMAIDHSLIYRIILLFFGFYPMLMALMWIVLSIFFKRKNEKTQTAVPPPLTEYPLVSVIVAAYAEEVSIGRTIESLLRLDYPNYEILIVNDGSYDRTAEVVKGYLDRGPISLLDKEVNEGKAMALNDALAICRGELLLMLDADVVVEPDILLHMLPHLQSGRVAAVAGNPRVANRDTFLQSLQAVEFSSIISMQRRAQRIWGRVMTVSGAVVAFRRSALLEAGLFSPDMATEDIDMTWKVQKLLWDVRYEPRAIAWMQVPPSFREWWKQRRRWARGLAQVLRRHHNVAFHWRLRRMWPVITESVLSVLWAHCFILITVYWVVCKSVHYDPLGSSPVPNFWGMSIATACLIQLGVGVWEDRRYDHDLKRALFEAIQYPLFYWMLTSLVTFRYTLPTVLARSKRGLEKWKIARVSE